MIVTGFLDLGKYEQRRKRTKDYIAAGTWLLGADVPLIIFAEAEHQAAIRALRPKGAETVWRTLKGRVPHDTRLESGLKRSRYAWDPLKDTPRYLWLMRQKLAWLRQGAELADQPVTWVDMGIRPQLGPASPRMLMDRPVEGIRLAELSYVPRAVRKDRQAFYADHYWPLAGGIIRGSPKDLRWLDERVEEEWQWCLQNGFAATDEMMMGFVRFQHPERFRVYYADHPFLVDDWHGVRGSRRLVTEMALRAIDDGSPAEAIERLNAVTLGLSRSG